MNENFPKEAIQVRVYLSWFRGGLGFNQLFLKPKYVMRLYTDVILFVMKT